MLKTLSAETTKPKPYLAVATGTLTSNYRLKTDHLKGLFSYFPKNQIVLGDDERILPGRAKPKPGIFPVALETINKGIRLRKEKGSMEIEITQKEWLVSENSIQGVIVARRGRNESGMVSG